MVELFLIEQILKSFSTMQKVMQWLYIVEKLFGSVWGTW